MMLWKTQNQCGNQCSGSMNEIFSEKDIKRTGTIELADQKRISTTRINMHDQSQFRSPPRDGTFD